MRKVKQWGSRKASGKIIQQAGKTNTVLENKEPETAALWTASNRKLRCLDWLYGQEKSIKSSGTVYIFKHFLFLICQINEIFLQDPALQM